MVIKYSKFDGNELDDIFLKMVLINIKELLYIQWLNQIIFIKDFCVTFWIFSVKILIGIIFFTDIFPILIIFVFVRIFFVWNIRISFFLFKTLFTGIIFVINLNIIIFITITFIINISLIVFTHFFFVCIICTLIISVRMSCFCIIRWFKSRIQWLKIVFAWLEKCLTSYRFILLISSFFCIHLVIVFIFSFRWNMTLNWTIVGKLFWMRNTWKHRSIILFCIFQLYVRYWCTSVGHYFQIISVTIYCLCLML